MTYAKFIYEAEKETIQQLDNGTWYLEPEWKDILCRKVESNLDKLDDNYLKDWWDIENVLRLEVERRNAQDSKKNDIIDWIYDVISNNIDPAMLDEENEFARQVIEFMKANHENKDNIIPFPGAEE